MFKKNTICTLMTEGWKRTNKPLFFIGLFITVVSWLQVYLNLKAEEKRLQQDVEDMRQMNAHINDMCRTLNIKVDED